MIDINENINNWCRSSRFKLSAFFKKWKWYKLGKQTIDYFNVINKLEKNDIYDIIFIVSRFSSLDNIIPIIENNGSKNIVICRQ